MIPWDTHCADCGTRYPREGLYQLEDDGRCYYCHQFYIDTDERKS